MEVVSKLELGTTAVVFPDKGICEGEYREFVGTNYGKGEIEELSKENRNAQD